MAGLVTTAGGHLPFLFNLDALVKSYNMPFCGTVTENNLSIISEVMM
jgi:hypothetical protein